jgi:hypothetical protein
VSNAASLPAEAMATILATRRRAHALPPGVAE